MLAGLGHRLRHLLRAAGLAKSTYYHLLSHPAALSRWDIEPMVAEIFARTPNGCGHRQIRMCLVHEFGVRVSHKSVLKVMRRMGLECRIRRPNPYRKYSSYRDETGARVENLLNRDFTADRPWVKLGTDVLRRTRVRLIRTVQERTGRVHHPLEHQTPPDTTGGTHPGGIPEHVPHSLIRYP